MLSGKNGSGAHNSRVANTTHSAAESANSPRIGAELQGKRVPPEVSASKSAIAAATIKRLPSMSSLCGRAWRGSRLSASRLARKGKKKSGMFIQKKREQFRYSDST